MNCYFQREIGLSLSASLSVWEVACEECVRREQQMFKDERRKNRLVVLPGNGHVFVHSRFQFLVFLLESLQFVNQCRVVVHLGVNKWL